MRISNGGLLEDDNCRLVGPVKKHLASPIKQIVLAGIDMSSGFELIFRFNKLAVFLVDLAKQIVQFSGVLLLRNRLGHLPSLPLAPE